MKNILITFYFIMMWFMSCNNSPGDQKPQTPIRSQIDTSLVWVDYLTGAPTVPGSYDGIDSLVKKYKLRYRRINAGCVVGEKEELLKAKYDQQNQRYFKEIEKIHGKDWKKRFDKELQVLDSINWVRAKQQDSLNKKTKKK